MPFKPAHFDGSSGPIELGFVKRECTPTELMELSIQLHLSGLSLAKAASILRNFGVDRH